MEILKIVFSLIVLAIGIMVCRGFMFLCINAIFGLFGKKVKPGAGNWVIIYDDPDKIDPKETKWGKTIIELSKDPKIDPYSIFFYVFLREQYSDHFGNLHDDDIKITLQKLGIKKKIPVYEYSEENFLINKEKSLLINHKKKYGLKAFLEALEIDECSSNYFSDHATFTDEDGEETKLIFSIQIPTDERSNNYLHEHCDDYVVIINDSKDDTEYYLFRKEDTNPENFFTPLYPYKSVSYKEIE